MINYWGTDLERYVAVYMIFFSYLVMLTRTDYMQNINNLLAVSVTVFLRDTVLIVPPNAD